MKKIILITGASSGIGKVTSKELLKKGYTVYATSRSVDSMKDLEKLGAYVLKLDVTKTESISSAVNTIINQQGKIDILVNNAGYGLYGSVEDTTIDDVKKQYDVNVFGLGEVIKHVVPYMRKEKSGHIINIASIAGKIYLPLGGWYHSSKFAVEGLSDCLRTELEQFNITVSIIEPAAIKTQFGNTMIPQLKKDSKGGAYEEMSKKIEKIMSATKDNGDGLEPIMVSNKIIDSIESSRPKHRYVVGNSGRIFIFIKWLFGTKVFDFLVKKMLNT